MSQYQIRIDESESSEAYKVTFSCVPDPVATPADPPAAASAEQGAPDAAESSSSNQERRFEFTLPSAAFMQVAASESEDEAEASTPETLRVKGFVDFDEMISQHLTDNPVLKFNQLFERVKHLMLCYLQAVLANESAEYTVGESFTVEHKKRLSDYQGRFDKVAAVHALLSRDHSELTQYAHFESLRREVVSLRSEDGAPPSPSAPALFGRVISGVKNSITGGSLLNKVVDHLDQLMNDQVDFEQQLSVRAIDSADARTLCLEDNSGAQVRRLLPMMDNPKKTRQGGVAQKAFWRQPSIPKSKKGFDGVDMVSAVELPRKGVWSESHSLNPHSDALGRVHDALLAQIGDEASGLSSRDYVEAHLWSLLVQRIEIVMCNSSRTCQDGDVTAVVEQFCDDLHSQERLGPCAALLKGNNTGVLCAEMSKNFPEQMRAAQQASLAASAQSDEESEVAQAQAMLS